MKGEKINGIVAVSTKEEGWPIYFLVTDCAVYEYMGQTFLERDNCMSGHDVFLPNSYGKKAIKDVRSDGESVVILLEDGDKVIFELDHDPFGSCIKSYSTVRFQSSEESLSWQSEFDEMDSII
jgi:hypothetical protein